MASTGGSVAVGLTGAGACEAVDPEQPPEQDGTRRWAKHHAHASPPRAMKGREIGPPVGGMVPPGFLPENQSRTGLLGRPATVGGLHWRISISPSSVRFMLNRPRP